MKPHSALIVAGHAIYQNGLWYGIRNADDDLVYEEHIRQAFCVADAQKYDALILSGGHTREHFRSVRDSNLQNTEAEGMRDFASDAKLSLQSSRLIVETWSRDSFENVFFSVLAFHRCFELWPGIIGIVSWSYKDQRFKTIADAIQLDFRFHGSGNLKFADAAGALTAEEKNNQTIAEFDDPLQRSKKFLGKRIERMPQRYGDNSEYINAVKAAYDVAADNKVTDLPRQSVVGDLIDAVEAHNEPDNAPNSWKPNWRSVEWPWSVRKGA